MEGDEPVFDVSLKKKKKKKSATVANEEAPKNEEIVEADDAAPIVEDTEDIGSMFADMKKKKKKSKKKTTTVDDEVEEAKSKVADLSLADQEAEGADANAVETTAATENGELADPEDAWQDSERDITYPELLARVFRIIREANPDNASGKGRRYVVGVPRVFREGAKKTAFSNIAEICRKMNRPPEHLISFIFAELGTEGSVDGSQQLIIRGKYKQKDIEVVLRNYINEYVTCKTCKSPDTTIKKEGKLTFLVCATCGSSRSVSAIKYGFKAQVGKRKATRQ